MHTEFGVGGMAYMGHGGMIRIGVYFSHVFVLSFLAPVVL